MSMYVLARWEEVGWLGGYAFIARLSQGSVVARTEQQHQYSVLAQYLVGADLV